jgi:hypothetical protein
MAVHGSKLQVEFAGWSKLVTQLNPTSSPGPSCWEEWGWIEPKLWYCGFPLKFLLLSAFVYLEFWLGWKAQVRVGGWMWVRFIILLPELFILSTCNLQFRSLHNSCCCIFLWRVCKFNPLFNMLDHAVLNCYCKGFVLLLFLEFLPILWLVRRLSRLILEVI